MSIIQFDFFIFYIDHVDIFAVSIIFFYYIYITSLFITLGFIQYSMKILLHF